MAVTNYYTVNGEIIGEHTTGQSRLDYLCDALGSVVTTVDQTQTVKSTATYKPYGADLATTGPQPSFGWVGSLGYRRTGRPHADLYNRARVVGSAEGRWTTVDPLWPWQSAYAYVESSPTSRVDPSGYTPSIDNSQIHVARHKCKVYHCKFNGGFRHEFMCTEGLGGGKDCSGGVWPGWNPCKAAARGDSSYGGDCLFDQGPGEDQYKCTVISTDCGEAAAMCSEGAKSMPNYYTVGFCYGYCSKLTCAMCNSYRFGTAERKACVCSRCGCSISGGIVSCMDPNGATQYDCGWSSK